MTLSPPDRPNIVLLTLDAIRADRSSARGYAYRTTPNIDRLLRHAHQPATSYAISPSTFGSFPSLMTSTRPLSYGGFDHGIANRPESLTALLRAGGYRTTHITTVHWANSFFGYDAETEELLIEPSTLANTLGIIAGRQISTWEARQGDAAELRARLAPVIGLFFDKMECYCRTRLNDRRDFRRTNNRFDHQHYRWPAVIEALAALEARWQADPAGFIDTILSNVRAGDPWLKALNWRRLRTAADLAETLLGEAVFGLAGRISPRLRDPWTFRRKKFPDAETVVDRVLLAADSAKDDSRPFFVWGHLFDAHLPYCAGLGKGWAADTRRWLVAVGHDPRTDPYAGHRAAPRSPEDWLAWNALYDAAIGFIDHQVGRLKAELAARGLGDTIIALTSDHGEEMGEHGDTGHKFRLYEHNTRTFTVIHHPDLGEATTPGLCTLMDVAPTIADMVGLPPPPAWEGLPYRDLHADPRREIVLETFFGSPCDFENRPIYFASRRDDLKLIWTERVDSHDRLGKPGPQLFDLAKDPQEQHNLAAERLDDVERLMAPILERRAALPGPGRAGSTLTPQPLARPASALADA